MQKNKLTPNMPSAAPSKIFVCLIWFEKIAVVQIFHLQRFTEHLQQGTYLHNVVKSSTGSWINVDRRVGILTQFVG